MPNPIASGFPQLNLTQQTRTLITIQDVEGVLMKKILFYVKQLIPCTYWSKYRLPNGAKELVIWKQWFKKPFQIKRFTLKNQWNSVSPHFGQGGIVSESSFNTTTCPQLSQTYSPFPGFSPVVGISEITSLLEPVHIKIQHQKSQQAEQQKYKCCQVYHNG